LDFGLRILDLKYKQYQWIEDFRAKEDNHISKFSFRHDFRLRESAKASAEALGFWIQKRRLS
jgi:hypothetical protein